MATAGATVIPLRQKQESRGGSTLVATPEPASLYHLIVLALQLHGPGDTRSERCAQCQEIWPCAQVCLACRLLDGL